MRKPFYLDKDLVIKFPKRDIYNGSTHELWFRDEGIPILGVIRGYLYDNYMIVFMNELDIPPIHPAVIMDWFNTYESLAYVQLGGNYIGDKLVPKLVVFKGTTIKVDDVEQEETDKSLIEESNEIDSKETIGFKQNESNSDQ